VSRCLAVAGGGEIKGNRVRITYIHGAHGLIGWLDLAWLGLAWLGLAWLGLAGWLAGWKSTRESRLVCDLKHHGSGAPNRNGWVINSGFLGCCRLFAPLHALVSQNPPVCWWWHTPRLHLECKPSGSRLV
jgi:hypothetical protein